MTIDYWLDEGAHEPVRAHTMDAGLDLYANEDKIIYPHSFDTVGTGLHMVIPDWYAGHVISRSGMNAHCGITSTGLIDSGYFGEIKVVLHNDSSHEYHVHRGDRISQLVISPIIIPTLCEFDSREDYENYYELSFDESARDADGFGSTGR